MNFSLGFFSRLSSRDRRAVQLGALALAPALLWVGVVKPYRTALGSYRYTADSVRRELVREEALLAMAKAFPDSLAVAIGAAARADSRFVIAANVAMAETEVTSLLQRLAIESRVLIKEIHGVDPDRGTKPPAGVSVIRLSVRGESDLTGILGFLANIDEHRYLLAIKELSLTPAAEPGPNVGALSFTVMVEAYSRISGSDSSASKVSRGMEKSEKGIEGVRKTGIGAEKSKDSAR